MFVDWGVHEESSRKQRGREVLAASCGLRVIASVQLRRATGHAFCCRMWLLRASLVTKQLIPTVSLMVNGSEPSGQGMVDSGWFPSPFRENDLTVLTAFSVFRGPKSSHPTIQRLNRVHPWVELLLRSLRPFAANSFRVFSVFRGSNRFPTSPSNPR